MQIRNTVIALLTSCFLSLAYWLGTASQYASRGVDHCAQHEAFIACIQAIPAAQYSVDDLGVCQRAAEEIAQRSDTNAIPRRCR